MNERIKELAVAAAPVNSSIPSSEWNIPKEFIEKFAELIVRECAKVAVFNDSGTVATADVAGHMAAGRSIAAQMIKEHFGVEE